MDAQNSISFHLILLEVSKCIIIKNSKGLCFIRLFGLFFFLIHSVNF